MIENIISATNDALYSYVLIILLVLGGLYFTVRTRFAQFRLLGQQFKAVTEKSDGGVSSFQALMVSTASRVGTGNIVGVSGPLPGRPRRPVLDVVYRSDWWRIRLRGVHAGPDLQEKES